MVRLTPKPLVIEDYDGFTKENDIFGYREFGERLANLVCNLEDESLTIALDGPWGSGKSTFAKQWAGHLRKRGMPVIYFDAFAADYHQDPFMALTEQIFAYTDDTRKRQATKNTKDKLVKIAGKLIPIAANIGTRALTAGLLDTELMKEAGAAISAGTDAAIAETEQAISQAVEQRLSAAGAESRTMESFKTELSNLVVPLFKTARAHKDAHLKPNEKPKPRLIFIIDELDRCRPQFALGILETIKHVFSTKGIYFLVVTNRARLEQFSNAGASDDDRASMYIEKLFDLSLLFPEQTSITGNYPLGKIELFLDQSIRPRYLAGIHSSFEIQIFSIFKTVLLTGPSHVSASLRDIEKIYRSLNLKIAAYGPDELTSITLLVLICALQETRPELYYQAKAGTLKSKSVFEFLGITDPAHEFEQWFWGKWLNDPVISTFSNEYNTRSESYRPPSKLQSLKFHCERFELASLRAQNT